jgi:hypothetical protein
MRLRYCVDCNAGNYLVECDACNVYKPQVVALQQQQALSLQPTSDMNYQIQLLQTHNTLQ